MQASLAPSPRQLDRTAPGMPPAVLLVDDHDLFRTGLRQLLTAQGLRVVGDCRCNDGALDMARRTGATVAVVDAATLDGAATAPLIEQLCRHAGDVGVAVFARDTSRAELFRAVRAGARAYVRKDEPVEQLAAAIRAVHAGDAWLEPHLLAMALELLRSGDNPTAQPVDMSERELEVLRLVAAGLENNEIAEQLGISAKTAKNHVSNILNKLQLSNRVQAAVWAVRAGIA